MPSLSDLLRLLLQTLLRGHSDERSRGFAWLERASFSSLAEHGAQIENVGETMALKIGPRMSFTRLCLGSFALGA